MRRDREWVSSCQELREAGIGSAGQGIPAFVLE